LICDARRPGRPSGRCALPLAGTRD
jgi:hypothetical protein